MRASLPITQARSLDRNFFGRFESGDTLSPAGKNTGSSFSGARSDTVSPSNV